jgi:hypothetical protein
MAIKINDLVLDIIAQNPRLSNDEVAAEVQRRVPGATTSSASVSSIKSKARKDGLLNETAIPSMAMPHFEVPSDLPEETDEERSDRIRRRYRTLERMAYRVANAKLPSLIVSGPPGLGKSFTVEKVLEDVKGPAFPHTADEDLDDEPQDGARLDIDLEDVPPYDIISGTITAVGLYIALYKQRNNGIVVLDDCDDVFRDETCLNILKAVLDSSDVRRVSYRKKAYWMEEMGIPDAFEFRGSVVFCTNIDFEMAIAKGSTMGAHFSALIDRSLYLSLTMRTKADFITRIRHVAIEDGLLKSKGLSEAEADEVMQFLVDNSDRFYGLSLRLVGQIAECYLEDRENWKDDVIATKMRTV